MSSLQFERLCNQAKKAFAQRDWHGAKDIYLQALAIDDTVPDVHQGLATLYFQLRDLRKAADHFRQVTVYDPMRAGAHINLGAILNLLDEYDEAIEALRRGIQLDPGRAEGYYNLGLVYRRRKQNDLAIEAYKGALRINPNLADAHLNLGNIYLDREQLREALRCYEAALETRPNWDKAQQALEQTEQAILLEEQEDQDVVEETSLTESETATRKKFVDIDPHKLIDPEVHGMLLDRVHADVKEAQGHCQNYQRHLLQILEPAIKELSSALLQGGSRNVSLDTAYKRFDEALAKMKALYAKLDDALTRTRAQGMKLPGV